MIELPHTMEAYVALGGVIAQIIGVFGMFSVIWMVQFIVYPSFLEIDETRWREFHRRHCRRMGFIVGPLMCCELFGAIAVLVMMSDDGFSIALLITSLLTWLVTAVIFVPIHRKLGRVYRVSLVRSLIKQNWVRTILWSLAAILWLARVIVVIL